MLNHNNSPNALTIGSGKTVAFYKLADGDPVQADSAQGTWFVDMDRRYLDTPEFRAISTYFDQNAQLSGDSTDFTSIEDTLYVYDSAGKTGPQLTLPSATLNMSNVFTVELWIAIDKFTAQNMSVLGMSGRDWDKGFSIGGLMNTSGASVACIMGTVSKAVSAQCNVASQFCYTLGPVKTWYHIACSRDTVNTMARIMVNDKNITNFTTVFNGSIPSLFYPGNLVLGTKDVGTTKSAGFNGYMKELRIWNRWLSNLEILWMMNNRLESLDHGSLIGYWPMTGGRMGDFPEISRHSVQDIAIDTVNPAGKAVYGIGSHDWVRIPALWNTPICRKDYVYSPQGAACVLKKAHYAPLINGTLQMTATGTKAVLTTWDSTFSVWAYHRNFKQDPTIFGINRYIVISCSVIGNVLRVNYGINTASTVQPGVTPTIGRWIHYGVITTYGDYPSRTIYMDSTTKDSASLSAPAITEIPTDIVFIFGSAFQGYIREAKVWTRPLSDSEMLTETFS